MPLLPTFDCTDSLLVADLPAVIVEICGATRAESGLHEREKCDNMVWKRGRCGCGPLGCVVARQRDGWNGTSLDRQERIELWMCRLNTV